MVLTQDTRMNVASPLDLPTDDVARLLRAIPRVVRVEVRVKTLTPKQRLIHLRDYHYETPERLKKAAQRGGIQPTKKDVESWYNFHCIWLARSIPSAASGEA
jgi:hypothetical protein